MSDAAMKTPKGRWKRGATVSGVAAFVVVMGFLWVAHRLHHNTDVEQAEEQAVELLARVGGANKVCSEADRMFREFGAGKLKFFDAADLKGYPILTALGKVDGIYPDNPACIQIRVGNHLDGYFILIPDTNGTVKYSKRSFEREVVLGRIYVYRQ